MSLLRRRQDSGPSLGEFMYQHAPHVATGSGLILVGAIGASRQVPVTSAWFGSILLAVFVYVWVVLVILLMAQASAHAEQQKTMQSDGIARTLATENKRLQAKLLVSEATRKGAESRLARFTNGGTPVNTDGVLERGSNGGNRSNGGSEAPTFQRTPRGLHVPTVHLGR